MNLYRISQDTNNNYDTYDSAIVAAETEEDARTINPAGDDDWRGRSWVQVAQVAVELVGVAVEGTKRGIVLASFNAG